MNQSIAGALTRYRVMAFVTGSFLLLLTVVTIIKYAGIAAGWEDPTFLAVAQWIGIVHGWIYIVYVAACFDLWRRAKWGIGRLATLALGGIVPVMSFVVERRVARDVAASLNA
jgi:integral membrane protein